MTTLPRFRTLAGVGCATAAVLLSALPAFAAPIGNTGPATASPAGVGAGYNNVINDHAANIQTVTVEGGDTVDTFCIEEGVVFNADGDAIYFSAPWAAATGTTEMAKVADIAVRSAEMGTPLADEHAEAAAVQLAIWKVGNGLDISGVPNASIVGRADALAAAAADYTQGPSSFALDIAAETDETNTVQVALSFTTDDESPLADETITVTTPAGPVEVVTNADGNAALSFEAPAEDGTVTATWSGTLPAGSVLLPPSDTDQKVITTTDADITRSAEATFAAAAVPTTTAPPVTEPPTTEPPVTEPPATVPAPAPAPAPEELPYTGTTATLGMLALAAGLVAAGVYGFRRSRSV